MPKGFKGFQKGHGRIGNNKGSFGKHWKISEEHKKRISLANKGKKRMIGENHWEWKGEDASKEVKHQWVVRWKGRPKKCELCGLDDNSRTYDWANIDHMYRRVLRDYIRMCRPCHRNYDKNRGVKTNRW